MTGEPATNRCSALCREPRLDTVSSQGSPGICDICGVQIDSGTDFVNIGPTDWTDPSKPRPGAGCPPGARSTAGLPSLSSIRAASLASTARLLWRTSRSSRRDAITGAHRVTSSEAAWVRDSIWLFAEPDPEPMISTSWASRSNIVRTRTSHAAVSQALSCDTARFGQRGRSAGDRSQERFTLKRVQRGVDLCPY